MVGQGLGCRRIVQRSEEADQRRAGLQTGPRIGIGQSVHGQQQVGFRENSLAFRGNRSSGGELLIGAVGCLAGADFDQHIGTALLECTYVLRHQRYATLSGLRFAKNPDMHESSDANSAGASGSKLEILSFARTEAGFAP